jgi:hypothetical protein
MGKKKRGSAQDTVTVVVDRRTAEDHYYALALALGAAGATLHGGEPGKGKGKGKGKYKTPKGKAPKDHKR